MNLAISTAEEIATAQTFILEKGREHYRDLPWRKTNSPWAILVSEVMLQQTQVPRVSKIFPLWMERFPAPSALAAVPLSEVLKAWSGLGYNRRALNLQKAAQILALEYKDSVPPSEEALRSLPGVGVYTARAVLAFAFNIASVFLETNIRTVFIRHFSSALHREANGTISDRDLEKIGQRLLDRQNPRAWYTALMDYGAWLKQNEGNFGKQAKNYRPQSPFNGSIRQLRGAILKTLLETSPMAVDRVAERLKTEPARIYSCALQLAQEGFLEIDAAETAEALESIRWPESAAFDSILLNLP